MKKYSFILAAVAVSMLVACNKEQDMPVSKNLPQEAQLVRTPGWTYIGAQAGDVTKSSIDDESAAFSWNTGDQIAVFSDDTYYVSQPLASTYDGTNAAVFAFDSDIESGRKDFAVYPANLVMDGTTVRPNSGLAHDDSMITISLPGSYKLADVQGEVSPTPMIAVNASGSGLAFKSICALVRITVKNIAWDAKSIIVRFPGKKVQGEFDLISFVAGTDGVVLDTGDEDEDYITITDLGVTAYVEEMVINVPVPMSDGETYDDVVVTVCDASGLPINYIVAPLKVVESVPEAWAPTRKSCRKVTASLPVFSTVKNGDVNAASRKTLVFAPGNLLAQIATVPSNGTSITLASFGTASAWKFAEHQYDAIGNTVPDGHTYSVNSLQDAQEGDWIDLFSWMGNDAPGANVPNLTDEQKYGISFPVSSSAGGWYGTTTTGALWFDWGSHEIGGYAANAWMTPTGDALENMLVYRKKDGAYYTTATKATLTTDGESPEPVAYGLVIIPDNYSHPYGVPELNNVYSHARYNKSTCPSPWQQKYKGPICSDNVYSIAQWKKLEGAGCVFLPLTNSRKLESNMGATSKPGDGWYWTSSTNGSNSYALAFNYDAVGTSDLSTGNDNLQAKKSRARYTGSAVRLTRWVKNE